MEIGETIDLIYKNKIEESSIIIHIDKLNDTISEVYTTKSKLFVINNKCWKFSEVLEEYDTARFLEIRSY